MNFIQRFLKPWAGSGNISQLTEKKSSAIAPLLTIYNANKPVWIGKDLKAYAHEGYGLNSVCFAAVNKLSWAIKYIPIKLYSGTDEIDDQNHPLLLLLKRPNKRMTQSALFEAMSAYMLLAGNNYLELVPPGLDPNRICDADNMPIELWPQMPNLMSVIPSKTGDVYAYHFKFNSEEYDWLVDPLSEASNIIHMKTFHPLDNWYGMSPIQAAAMGISSHNQATIWNNSLVSNSGQPSGALIYKPANNGNTLTADQRQTLHEDLDNAVVGAKNAGRPLLLDGEYSWQQMSLSPKDMDWLQSKITSAKEVAMVFGVPPYMLGIEDPTYNNIREARASMYEDTAIPLLDFILDYLNHSLCPLFGDDLHLEIDLNRIPALAPRRAEMFTMIGAANWLTTNEKRQATGYPVIETDKPDPDAEPGDIAELTDIADQVLVPSTMVPLDGLNENPKTHEPPPAFTPGNNAQAVDEDGNPISDDGMDGDADSPNIGADGKPLPANGKPGANPPKNKLPGGVAKGGKKTRVLSMEDRLLRKLHAEFSNEIGYGKKKDNERE